MWVMCACSLCIRDPDPSLSLDIISSSAILGLILHKFFNSQSQLTASLSGSLPSSPPPGAVSPPSPQALLFEDALVVAFLYG